jgi:hypothetical protein
MKHMHQNQEFRFNEVLFEHRNKEYGAYVLRNESDKILTKALFIGVGLLAAISLTPLAVNVFKSSTPIHIPVDGPPVVIKLKKVDQVDPPAQIKTQPAAVRIKTIDKTVPEPKAVVTNEKKDTPKDEQNAVAGIQTSAGKEVTTPAYIPIAPPINTNGTSTTPVKPPVQAEDNTPKTVVDVEANFMGGLDAFRNKVMNNFDGSGMESDGVMKTTVTFIVEKDGTISGLKADGKNADFNSEALRTIKSIKGKWVPAKVKGQPVRSYFKFPISMKFEN